MAKRTMWTLDTLNDHLNKNGRNLLFHEYKNTRTKSKCECLICNHVWSPTPSSILSNRGCPKCSHRIPWTLDTLNEHLSINNRNLIFLEFSSTKEKQKCQCLICNHVWKVRPLQIVFGYGCPKCSHRIPWTLDTLNDHLNKNGRNLLFHEYKNVDTKSKCQCLMCNHVWNTIPKSVLHGHGCPNCVNISPWTLDTLNDHLNKNGRNLLFHEYKNVNTKSKCQCLTCSHVWNVKPNSILNESGCPRCSKRGIKNTSTEPHILYYVKIKNKNLWKIGITKKSLKRRFSKDFDILEILFIKNCDSGIIAYNIEQQIIKSFYEYKYYGPKVLQFGNTEIFIKDIFNGNYNIEIPAYIL